jgi:hypothetical protein
MPPSVAENWPVRQTSSPGEWAETAADGWEAERGEIRATALLSGDGDASGTHPIAHHDRSIDMKSLRALRRVLAPVVLCLSCPLLAAIQLVPVVSSGLSSPVFVGNAGDGTNRLFIVEQGGVIRVLQPGSSTPTAFLDVHAKVVAGGEQGLLGLAFHPQYAANGRFFVYYTRAGDGTIVIAEHKVSGNPNVADPAESVLLTIPHPTNANHNGGMLAFGPDGYLYVGVGDGGGANDVPNNAQNIGLLLGKILRIDVSVPLTYSSPSTNPFFGATPGRDEIFTYGMRNPWRFSFDRFTGVQWVADVGQGAREEVDTPIVSGGNYGWRVFEGSACTNNDPALCASPQSYVFPVFDYLHSGGRCSITGGYAYRGVHGAVPSGTYIYGDYCSGEIMAWDGTAQSVLLDTTQNISSFGEDEDGELYVVNLGGTVSKIVSTTRSYDEVQKAYVASYGRPADPAGQAYWARQMDLAGGSLSAIIVAFGNSSEFNRRYGGLSFTALVTRIYRQALNRDPDAAGLAYYVGELQAGRRTLQTITLDVLNGAVNAPDSTTVANKLDVAAYYTARVAAGCAYGSEADGVSAIAGVTDMPATVTAAKAAIDDRCGI